MQIGEALADFSNAPEVRRERDARQLALQICGEALAILRRVQQAIDVVEDVPFADLLVFVLRAKFIQRPVGDVLAESGAVFVVEVDGETLKSIARREMNVWNVIGHQRSMRGAQT